MGIRVHKMIGYGLTDVKVADDGYTLADERINANSILLDYDTDTDAANTDAYFEFAKQRDVSLSSRRMFSGNDKDIPDDDPFESVVWEPEYGLGSVLCLRPVGTRTWGWYRSDDAMDWMEESYNHDQQNRVQVFDRGIFPFDGYMNAETGERIKQDIYTWVRARNSEGDPDFLDTLAEIGGFQSHAEASRLVVPAVPEEVHVLAEFGQLFTSDDVWKQLRPMLYVYWG